MHVTFFCDFLCFEAFFIRFFSIVNSKPYICENKFLTQNECEIWSFLPSLYCNGPRATQRDVHYKPDQSAQCLRRCHTKSMEHIMMNWIALCTTIPWLFLCNLIFPYCIFYITQFEQPKLQCTSHFFRPLYTGDE